MNFTLLELAKYLIAFLFMFTVVAKHWNNSSKAFFCSCFFNKFHSEREKK